MLLGGLHEQIVDAHVVRVVAVQRSMARDRLRVVAGDAVEVAALQEDDEPVAGPVDAAVRDRVGDEPAERDRPAPTALTSPRDALIAPDPLHGALREVVSVLAARGEMVARVPYDAAPAIASRSLLRTRYPVIRTNSLLVEVEREVTHATWRTRRG